MTTGRRPHTCVFGLGWGDEGKGKVVDLLCPAFDLVVRFNGGANAGHTVCVGDETFALHLLPTGVLHDDVIAVIGPGVVVDPIALISEMDALAARGVEVAPRLRISDRAHLVLQYHKVEDQLAEQAADRDSRIGTTARGIGPCYADKMRRSTAVRFTDLLHEVGLDDRVAAIAESRRAALRATYGDGGVIDVESIVKDVALARERLRDNICDTTRLLHESADGGGTILFEAANGMLLDIDHGTYPFVTSSSTGPHGIGVGAGFPPTWVGCAIGVAKAYSTRVGSGPFATELCDDIGDRIRKRGKEFGTTTGRPRRCGWFDSIACRYAGRLGGVTDLALLHLDTLSGFEEVGVCVAYRYEGETLTTPPASASVLEAVEPVIEFMPGWCEDLQGIRNFDDLPQNTRNYIDRIETLVGVPVSIVGVGPERSQTIVRGRLADMIDLKRLGPATHVTQ